MGKSYSLTKRPTNGRQKSRRREGKSFRGIWYVRWRQPDGSWGPQRSTGKTSRDEAEAWCEQRIIRHAGVPQSEQQTPTLSAYSDGFYCWPDGRYARDRRNAGHRVSEQSAAEHRSRLRRHVLRILGASTPLGEIDRRAMRGLRDALMDEGLAPTTVNHVVDTAALILQAAAEDGIIREAPQAYRAGGGTQKPRGSLTLDEAQRLFIDATWLDPRDRLASRLAAATGLRLSEIQGLVPQRVLPDYYLDVSVVWDRQHWRLKPATKNGEPRLVPITEDLHSRLVYIILDNPHSSGPRYVFYDTQNPNAPYATDLIRDGLYYALSTIHIGEAERSRRNIGFHSWRHFANSRLVESGVSETVVRSVIGHHSQAMTQRYYHLQDVDRIRAAQTW